jgi:hypothetical protein
MKREDRAALGGMRNPASALARAPSSCVAGDLIRPILDEIIADHESLRDPVRHILAGLPSTGFSTNLVAQARSKLWSVLGISQPPLSTGLQPDLIEKYISLAKDPDIDLAPWLRNGAPLGALKPITSRGIFPVDKRETTDPCSLAPGWDGDWSNYISAEEEPDIVSPMLDTLVADGNAKCYDLDKGEKPKDFTVASRLGLVRKVKPDGSIKYRLVWDFRRSGVNETISQGERILLPSLLDVVRSARGLADRRSHLQIFFIGVDVSEAFHLIPLNEDEQALTAARFGNKLYIFKVLVFGSVSAPTVWGRYAAWLGRSTMAISRHDHLRMHMFVDDPLYLAAGDENEVTLPLTRALLWAVVAGFPLAWHKSDGGSTVTWIGANISMGDAAISISIPEDKIIEYKEGLKYMKTSRPLRLKAVRSIAGKLMFASSLVPRIRPFTRSIWQTVSECIANDPLYTKNKQLSLDIQWLNAFFKLPEGELRRTFPFRPEATGSVRVSTDASPWGIGGVLYLKNQPIAFFADQIQQNDLKLFNAKIGDPAFTTLWEALAIAVAIKLWSSKLGPTASFELRSDSLGALSAIAKKASKAAEMNKIIAEITLMEAVLGVSITSLSHIPGLSNDTPDALSRLWAPEAKSIPARLQGVTRESCPDRDRSFWLTMPPPRSRFR